MTTCCWDASALCCGQWQRSNCNTQQQ